MTTTLATLERPIIPKMMTLQQKDAKMARFGIVVLVDKKAAAIRPNSCVPFNITS